MKYVLDAAVAFKWLVSNLAWCLSVGWGMTFLCLSTSNCR
jgi:hypothetical protein